ncbi:plant-specific domain TIGR01615 family protein [Musa troglodytarum]|uniref:Plant-specific domain TIGR01615 family protein n=1 Tax=Musa troglodytarum TaxID=320322 RepID=A0A9E7GIZ4_9LILI|nr:plant-specific domain TIGR01615 family protein [Musa troglodytarum]
MAVFLRATRVTTLLDDKAKAHLREADDSHRVPGYDSSGSEHDSPCLSGLVHAFLEHAHADSLSADVGAAAHPRYSSDDDLADDPDCTAATVVRELMDPAAEGDRFRVRLAADVYSVVEGLAVAGEETMRQVVRVVADAIRRSLRAQDLHIPPWRKSRYMIAKWLGPYRRTTNAVPASPGGSVSSSGAETSCRSVGFTTPAKGPATRTR